MCSKNKTLERRGKGGMGYKERKKGAASPNDFKNQSSVNPSSVCGLISPVSLLGGIGKDWQHEFQSGQLVMGIPVFKVLFILI